MHRKSAAVRVTPSGPPAPASDEDKLKELILYIAEKSAMDPYFGAVKLNKILFYSEFLAYARLNAPITGVEYRKLPQGPVPRRLVPVRTQLESDCALAIQPVAMGEYIQNRPVNLRAPVLSKFTAAEISIVDEVLESLRGKTASECSLESHKLLGWKAAKGEETIPYQAVFLNHEPLTAYEIERGREISVKWEQVPR